MASDMIVCISPHDEVYNIILFSIYFKSSAIYNHNTICVLKYFTEIMIFNNLTQAQVYEPKATGSLKIFFTGGFNNLIIPRMEIEN